jgi:hypothetical protein
MQAAFLIRVDDASRLCEIDRLFGQAGGESVVHDNCLLVSLRSERPYTQDEVEFAIRALLPAGSFTVERR